LCSTSFRIWPQNAFTSRRRGGGGGGGRRIQEGGRWGTDGNILGLLQQILHLFPFLLFLETCLKGEREINGGEGERGGEGEGYQVVVVLLDSDDGIFGSRAAILALLSDLSGHVMHLYGGQRT